MVKLNSKTKQSNEAALAAIENTEEKILQAAREEFIQTGLKGARMQKIADRAGVNKALLHYYFRSKEKLYEASLKGIAITFWDSFEKVSLSTPPTTDFKSLLKLLIKTHISVMSSNPLFPKMMLREIADGGSLLPFLATEMISKYGKIPQRVMVTFKAEIDAGRIKPVKPVHVIMNILGMCIVTFLMQPFGAAVSRVFGAELTFDEHFLEERIESIVGIIEHGLYIKDNT